MDEILLVLREFRNETNARFDSLETEFKAFRQETVTRLERVETRIGALEEVVQDTQANVKECYHEVTILISRFDRFEAKTLENRADMREMTARIARLEARS